MDLALNAFIVIGIVLSFILAIPFIQYQLRMDFEENNGKS